MSIYSVGSQYLRTVNPPSRQYQCQLRGHNSTCRFRFRFLQCSSRKRKGSRRIPPQRQWVGGEAGGGHGSESTLRGCGHGSGKYYTRDWMWCEAGYSHLSPGKAQIPLSFPPPHLLSLLSPPQLLTPTLFSAAPHVQLSTYFTPPYNHSSAYFTPPPNHTSNGFGDDKCICTPRVAPTSIAREAECICTPRIAPTSIAREAERDEVAEFEQDEGNCEECQL